MAGVISTAWDCEGAEDDIITIMRPVQDDFTISFWMKPDNGARSGSQWGSGEGLVDGDVNGVYNDYGVSYLYVDGKNQPVFGTGW